MPKIYFHCYTANDGTKRWRLIEKFSRLETDKIARSTNRHDNFIDCEIEIEKIVDYIQEHGDEMLENIQYE